MNTNGLLRVLLIVGYTCPLAAHQSALRPRVQLAHIQKDLTELLTALNASTISEGHQAIKLLKSQVQTLERKNEQLRHELQNTSIQKRELMESSKKIGMVNAQIDTLKKQLRAHHHRLKKALDKLSQDIA